MNPISPSTPRQEIPLRVDQVRERAYYLWLEKGCPVGDDQAHWHEAERQLRQSTAASAEAVSRAAAEPTPFSLRKTVASHLADPTHRFHSPHTAHDARLNVAAGEAPQRVRGRHLGGTMQPKARTAK